METLVAGATAALLTLFDLDRTFYVPSKANRKFALYCWWFSFILINGLLAVLLFFILKDIEAFKEINAWLKAVVIGVGYLALVRLKFATFNFQGKDVPFGLEAFYDAGKNYVFRRINTIAIQARRDETNELANSETLEKLAQDAKFFIEADSLLTAEERRERKTWLVKVLQDANISKLEKKITLANYIKSGQMIQ
jgi:hypothetical protein